MTDDNKEQPSQSQQDTHASVITAMLEWFTHLPRWLKGTLAAMLGFSVICVALWQVAPWTVLAALGGGVESLIQRQHEVADRAYADTRQERQDMIGLLNGLLTEYRQRADRSEASLKESLALQRQINEQVRTINARLSTQDGRLATLEQRIGRVESRLDVHLRRVGGP